MPLRPPAPTNTPTHPHTCTCCQACRFGLPEITNLLVQRGAAVNGGPAAAFAPKSPLDEALAYARANAQSYGTTSDRATYMNVVSRAGPHVRRATAGWHVAAGGRWMNGMGGCRELDNSRC